MKYLTLELIKAQSRIDYAIEDALLELYGAAAEDTVLNLIGCSYAELTEKYGEVPTPIVQATLMLVEVSYTQRSPISSVNMWVVPYTFDLLIKPYILL